MELLTSLPLIVKLETAAFQARHVTLDQEVSVEPADLLIQRLNYISL